MSRPILRLNDGYDHTLPELRVESEGAAKRVEAGRLRARCRWLFRRDTEAALKQFQSEHDLDDDGIAGALTWAALLGTPALVPDKVYPTTIPRNDSGYLGQLDAATQYLAFIKQGAQQYGIDVPVLGGLGSRESNWGLPCYAPRWRPTTAARATSSKPSATDTTWTSTRPTATIRKTC